MVRQAHLSQPVRVQDRSAEQTEMLETSALALLTESWSAVGLQWQANHQSSPGRLTCLSLEAVRACRFALGRPNFLRRVRWLC